MNANLSRVVARTARQYRPACLYVSFFGVIYFDIYCLLMLEVDACNKRKLFHARKQCLGELALNKFQLLRRPLFFSPFAQE